MPGAPSGVAAFWAAAAPGWIRHADRHDVRGRPLGDVALRALAVRPGERVLDVGCGCGGTTAELAALASATVTGDTAAVTGDTAAVTGDAAVVTGDAAAVKGDAVTVVGGAGGFAVGVDISAAMVEAARSRFPAAGHPGLDFVAADIERLDVVPGGPFDAAYSRMVLMLLADPVAGCATVRRSLRPGGRLAATVFRAGPGNAWLPAAMLGAAPHLGPLPPLPVGAEPGPFALADPDRITRVLTAAGFVSVSAEPHDVVLDAPDDPDDVAEWLIELGPAGAPYRQAPAPARAAARAGATRLLARFREAGTGYRIPSALWLITARTPD